MPRRLCGRCVCTAVTGGINSSAGRACAFVFGAIGRVSRAPAAGVTWASRTLKAPWAGRAGHTTVIDAAGAIYVLGGVGGGIYADESNVCSSHRLQDVWASTDGGARAGLRQRGVVRVGTSGVLRGTTGLCGATVCVCLVGRR